MASTGYLALAALVCIAFLSPCSVNAATRYWRNAVGSGNWSTPGNWSNISASGAGTADGGIPAASDLVRIEHSDGVSHTVTLDVTTPTLGLVTINQSAAGTAVDTLSITTNVSMTAGALFVGGYSGGAPTVGRAAVTQSAGSMSMAPGLDLGIAYVAGSTGTYTLSGTGAFVAPQSEFIGYGGNGTFTQTGGTNTVQSGTIGYFNVGSLAGAVGAYNLSGGTLSVSKSEIIGDSGTGSFTQTGGTNTLTGTNSMFLGNTSGGSGTYTANGTAVLNVGGDLNVGFAASGSGTLNVQGNANVNITGALKIGASDQVNMSSGTLRFKDYSRNASGAFNFTGGTVRLAPSSLTGGIRYFSFDPVLVDLYSATSSIANGRNLVTEGPLILGNGTSNVVNVSNAALTTVGDLSVAKDDDNAMLNITNGSAVNSAKVIVGDTVDFNSFPVGTVNVSQSTWNTGWLILGNGGQATLNITNGGYVVSSDVSIGFGDGPNSKTNPDAVLVSGPGSTFISNNSFEVGGLAHGNLTIEKGASVYVAGELEVWLYSQINMNGGTLRFGTLNLAGLSEGLDYAGKLNYNGGTLEFAGDRNVGTDADIQRFYGMLPVIPTGKGLIIENRMTVSSPLHLDGGSLKTFILDVTTGGSIDFDGGVFELTGGPVTGLNNLTVPAGGEFRAVGSYSFPVTGIASSVITATGNLTIGSATAVNGFATQGTLAVGSNTVTLLDANDVVLDALSLTSLGAAAAPGTLNAANGLTLNFGGNITGYGTVSTPNTAAKPTIINGHVTGASATQKLTMAGYVKGVGTFDNVTFSGTFSPGFSPTTSYVGNVGFASTNTLLMEIGGTTAGSQYDQLISSGQLALDGTLQLALINGFTPVAGQSFNLFDWQSLVGTFSGLSLPALGGSLSWNTSQLYATGIVSVIGTGSLPGDFNLDGKVDAADYVVWRTGTVVAATQANYNLWRANFGNTAGSGAVAQSAGAVPEPLASVLILTCAVCALARRERVAG
jgi:T5SS/PEP-CTERM-associated repeat protein